MLQNNYAHMQLLSLCSRAHELQLLKPACSRAQEPQLMSTCATVTKPVYPRASKPQVPSLRYATTEACASVAENKRSHCSEKPAHHNKVTPCLLQLEKVCTQQTKTQCSQKKSFYEEIHILGEGVDDMGPLIYCQWKCQFINSFNKYVRSRLPGTRNMTVITEFMF